MLRVSAYLHHTYMRAVSTAPAWAATVHRRRGRFCSSSTVWSSMIIAMLLCGTSVVSLRQSESSPHLIIKVYPTSVFRNILIIRKRSGTTTYIGLFLFLSNSRNLHLYFGICIVLVFAFVILILLMYGRGVDLEMFTIPFNFRNINRYLRHKSGVV